MSPDGNQLKVDNIRYLIAQSSLEKRLTLEATKNTLHAPCYSKWRCQNHAAYTKCCGARIVVLNFLGQYWEKINSTSLKLPSHFSGVQPRFSIRPFQDIYGCQRHLGSKITFGNDSACYLPVF